LGNWHYFVAGAAAAVATHRLGSGLSGLRSAAALGVSVLFCCIGALATTEYPLLVEKGVWTLPMWLCLLALLADPSCPLALASARLAPSAVLSYPLYILHIPLIQILRTVLPEGLDNSKWQWLPEICIIVALAAAIHTALESLIMAYERRKCPKSESDARSTESS
jgi:peptidoglycan/LPS O-acetylase OafA/YrhL